MYREEGHLVFKCLYLEPK